MNHPRTDADVHHVGSDIIEHAQDAMKSPIAQGHALRCHLDRQPSLGVVRG